MILRICAGVLALGLSMAPTVADEGWPSDWAERAAARMARPPLGLPPLPKAAGPPPSPSSIALGRKLFFDRRLSLEGSMSCGMCHIPEQGFTNNELRTPVGTRGRTVRRNAPTLFNVAYETALFRDGREVALEIQALAPLVDPREMANPSIDFVLAKIRSLADYDGLFEMAYGERVAGKTLGRALADYQRSLLSAESPFDRWYFGGDDRALGPDAKRGFALFVGRAGCAACHRIDTDHAVLTDHGFHDTGIGRDVLLSETIEHAVMVEVAPGVVYPVPRATIASVHEGPMEDLGRYEVTGRPEDRRAYKTPSLRNVALTAPYMHDGSVPTLDGVVRHYSVGKAPRNGGDPTIRPLDLDDGEIADLVAFLESLTGSNVADLIDEARQSP